ncbi:MAG: beta galactosidase jelly roll domain-containing protein [bacterium]
MKYSKRCCIVMVLGLMIASTSGLHAQGWKALLDLSGTWRFELGDSVSWSNPAYNDIRWSRIEVPSPWEEQGFQNYNGYAWYRKHFRVNRDLVSGRLVYLLVGYIDDVSEIYLNGRLIGYAGQFPPRFTTAYTRAQSYVLPLEFLHFDRENVLAVRVYDLRSVGGITRGLIGLFEPRNYPSPDLDLSGPWKFSTGDNRKWRDEGFEDSDWEELRVPGFWDTQGYRHYDGYAWYRVRFKLPEQLRHQSLTMLAGRIDDFDEVYVNGTLIGRTGDMSYGVDPSRVREDWKKLRAYEIPRNLLHAEGENVIAIRVLDAILHGGIYDGPVGLVRTSRYKQWNKENAPQSKFWDWFKDIFLEPM